MTTDNALMTTTGGDNMTGDYVQYDHNTVYPYTWPYTWPQPTQTITVTSPPFCCDDNVHVFGCDRALECKCGKVKRAKVVQPPKCPHCGKRHK